MDDTLSLGTDVATWAIKDFSVVLRQQITQAARRQGCTVGEWLHGYFQRHGIDGQQFAPVNLAPVEPMPAARQWMTSASWQRRQPGSQRRRTRWRRGYVPPCPGACGRPHGSGCHPPSRGRWRCHRRTQRHEHPSTAARGEPIADRRRQRGRYPSPLARYVGEQAAGAADRH